MMHGMNNDMDVKSSHLRHEGRISFAPFASVVEYDYSTKVWTIQFWIAAFAFDIFAYTESYITA